MRKMIEIVHCDWCKTSVERAQVVNFNQANFDLCPKCMDEIVLKLGGGIECIAIPTGTDKPKRNKKKADDNVVVDGEVTPNPDLLAEFFKASKLDMRQAHVSNIVDRIMEEIKDKVYSSKQAFFEDLNSRIATVRAPFVDCDEHRAVLQGLLEEHNFDFSKDEDRIESSKIKETILREGVALENLRLWLDGNIETLAPF